MSVAALAAELRRIMAALPKAHLDHAAEQVAGAHTTLDATAKGAQSPAIRHAVRQLAEANTAVGQARQLIAAAKTKIEWYLERLGVEVGPATPIAVRRHAASGGDSAGVEHLKHKLPPAVPKPNPTGRKTHGLWRDESGKLREEVSGRDEDSAEAWELLRQARIPLPSEPVIVTHVEVKLAARMVREQRRHVEIVINNRPCPGRFGCDVLLPVILPEGYSMTIHGPGYRQTFTGGKKPWWH
ncbi:DddA-like double-stranded DNA deaminase toxin [Actinokineospora sp. HUAS TT18]|uniref:DddA-like double-stranded DNA deaminase toxin n=1 Tax=Actinokineospora sp. HUAS TT18 TaxID=3447451 RepID=UPI003F520D7B